MHGVGPRVHRIGNQILGGPNRIGKPGWSFDSLFHLSDFNRKLLCPKGNLRCRTLISRVNLGMLIGSLMDFVLILMDFHLGSVEFYFIAFRMRSLLNGFERKFLGYTKNPSTKILERTSPIGKNLRIPYFRRTPER